MIGQPVTRKPSTMGPLGRTEADALAELLARADLHRDERLLVAGLVGWARQGEQLSAQDTARVARIRARLARAYHAS